MRGKQALAVFWEPVTHGRFRALTVPSVHQARKVFQDGEGSHANGQTVQQVTAMEGAETLLGWVQQGWAPSCR